MIEFTPIIAADFNHYLSIFSEVSICGELGARIFSRHVYVSGNVQKRQNGDRSWDRRDCDHDDHDSGQ